MRLNAAVTVFCFVFLFFVFFFAFHFSGKKFVPPLFGAEYATVKDLLGVTESVSKTYPYQKIVSSIILVKNTISINVKKRPQFL